LTQRLALRARRPLGVFRIGEENVDAVRRWLAEWRPEVLNVAGRGRVLIRESRPARPRC